MAHIKKSGYKRRWFYKGWNNYTKFERDQIQLVKNAMRSKYKIDLDRVKPYGPKPEDSCFKEGTNEVVSGHDESFGDDNILRFCYGRRWNVEAICSDLIYHLEWRQIYMPIPRLTKEIIRVLKYGIIYMHGRTMD